MEAKKGPSLPDDEVTQRLREAARRRRPWSLLALLLVALVLFGPLAAFVWWTWPEGDPPRLAIVAVDQLDLPNEDTILRAFLEPVEPPERKPRLGGHRIEIEERGFAPANHHQPQKQAAASQADGSVTVPWRTPEKAGTMDIVARYPGNRKRRGAEDRTRLFVRPAKTPLLLVDIADTLSPESATAWEEKNVLDIPPRPAASKALQEATKRGFQIVYVAVSAPSPLVYRKYRGWIMNQSGGEHPFPAGPVLGKTAYSQEESAAREAILRELKERFQGPMTALVGTGRAAAVCRAVGVRTLLLGKDPAPQDVVRIPALDKIAAELTDSNKQ